MKTFKTFGAILIDRSDSNTVRQSLTNLGDTRTDLSASLRLRYLRNFRRMIRKLSFAGRAKPVRSANGGKMRRSRPSFREITARILVQ